MITYKPIDLFAQLTLVLLLLIGLFTEGSTGTPAGLLFPLAIVQLISVLLHFAAGPQPWKQVKLRKIHLIGIGLIIGLVLFAFLQDSFVTRSGDKDDKYLMPGLKTLIITIIPTLLLMLFYLIITWVEWRRIQKIKKEGR